MFLLDSNILIYYLEGEEKIRAFIDFPGRALFISVISATELLAKKSLTKRQLRIIEEFLGRFSVIEMDKGTAMEAAALKRKYPLKFPDAVMAATAVVNGLTLVSRDKVFKKVRECRTVEL